MCFRTAFSDFAAKHGKHEVFKAIEKMKDREALFTEYLTDIKKKDKESSKTKHDKVRCLCSVSVPWAYQVRFLRIFIVLTTKQITLEYNYHNHPPICCAFFLKSSFEFRRTAYMWVFTVSLFPNFWTYHGSNNII